MKTKFDEWRASDGRLSFCAPVFKEPREKRAGRAVSSNFAHPYAGTVTSKRAAKKPSPYLATQYAVFGAKDREKAQFSRDFAGVRVEGFRERLEFVK
jgi:hypothetical protein